MPFYKSLNVVSGVESFDVLESGISVTFKRGSTYVYTYRSAGRHHIERMIELAQAGQGLNSYIRKHVNNLFEYKA